MIYFHHNYTWPTFNSTLTDLTSFSVSCHRNKIVVLTVHKWKKERVGEILLTSLFPITVTFFKQMNQGQSLIIFLLSYLAKFTFLSRKLLKFIPFSKKQLLEKPYTYFNLTILVLSDFCFMLYIQSNFQVDKISMEK